MESADGRAWSVLPPAPMLWPEGVAGCNHFEYGGCERIGGKYYLIGGLGSLVGYNAYSMFTLVADDPRGPLRPDMTAFRLCGSSSEHVYYTYTQKTIYPERGNIYDRRGHLMAGNTEVYELGADLRYVRDPQTIALTVADLLDLPYEDIYAALTVDFDPTLPRYVVLSKTVPPEKIVEIKILLSS